eukprot:PITA_35258
MYAKCGNLENARQMFDKMSQRDVVSWTAMIAGYAQNGHASEALIFFNQMQRSDAKPNSVTIVSVLSAFAYLASLQQADQIHSYIIITGFESNVSVGTALVDLYAKCGNIESAHKVFDKMPQKNLISWTAMVSGYGQNGYGEEALSLFHRMHVAGLKPDSITIVNVLSVCGDLGSSEQGKWIHDYIIQSGLESDVSVGKSLVTMHAKCGKLQVARGLFDKLSITNVVSWNAMIAGYTQNEHAEEALKLFYQMQLAEMKPSSVTMVMHRMETPNEAFTLFSKMQFSQVTPNLVTMVSLLPAFACSADPEQGKRVHEYIIRSGLESDVSVGTALVDMYAKCGNIEVAARLFDKISKRDVVTWNAMIAGYAQNGHAAKALTLFHEMQLAGVQPNSVAMTCVLSACAHLAALQEGKRIHDYIIRNGLQSDVSVATSLIDMLWDAWKF